VVVRQVFGLIDVLRLVYDTAAVHWGGQIKLESCSPRRLLQIIEARRYVQVPVVPVARACDPERRLEIQVGAERLAPGTGTFLKHPSTNIQASREVPSVQ